MSRSRPRRLVFGLLLTCMADCSGPLPSPSVITSLRLLTISASEPDAGAVSHSDVAVGDAVEIRAVWVDGSRDAGRPIWFYWRICAAGGDSDPRTCLSMPGLGLEPGGGAAIGRDTFVVQTTDLPPPGPADETGATSYDVLLVMCPVSAPTFDSTLGQYACPSEANIPEAQREGIQAFRRLVVRPAPPLNANPTIARITIAGQDGDMDAGLTVDHCPLDSNGDPTCSGVPLVLYPAPGSAESLGGDAAVPDGADGAYETLLASFFVTGGSTDRPRSVATVTAPNGEDGALTAIWYPSPMPGSATVWFVLHDGHGGDVARSASVTVR